MTKDGVLFPKNSPNRIKFLHWPEENEIVDPRFVGTIASSSSPSTTAHAHDDNGHNHKNTSTYSSAPYSFSPDKQKEVPGNSNANVNTTIKTTNTSSTTEEDEDDRGDHRDYDENHDNSTLPTDTKGKNKNKNKNETSNQNHSNSNSNSNSNRDRMNSMTKRELFLAAFVFCAIVGIVVTVTAIVFGSKNNKKGRTVPSSPTTTPSDKDTTGPPPSVAIPKLSVKNEWKLVYSAIRDNPVTNSLLSSQDGDEEEELLSEDPSFYKDLVTGMVFSEDHRDWIPAELPLSGDNDDMVSMYGMTTTDNIRIPAAYANSNGNAANNKKRTLTPNQKATAWLLYHDQRKDPNESVWRWALASIYFKMGGPGWTIFRPSTNKGNVNGNVNGNGNVNVNDNGNEYEPKWFTSASLCDWERLEGCNSHPYKTQLSQKSLLRFQKRYRQQLPVELDFAESNLTGGIATEFALLKLYNNSDDNANTTINAYTNTSTVVRSITLTENQLIGEIPGRVFEELFPSLGKLYLDSNQLTGTIPSELGGLGEYENETKRSAN
uniref:L domain-like protein n=1 Tax=Pseudo-nitzschia australis TaxID=44445 RepID=A0A7S4EGB7_9STRA